MKGMAYIEKEQKDDMNCRACWSKSTDAWTPLKIAAIKPKPNLNVLSELDRNEAVIRCFG